MAPEQLTADPIDRRVDIWALGVTLWEMLAVKRLFRRDTTANTIHSVLYDEILPPSDFRAQVPKALDGVEPKILTPRQTWADPADYDRTAQKLAEMFIANFEKFAEHVDNEVQAAGPLAGSRAAAE